MVWVWVFLGIAVLGLVVAVSYAVWLWHKASDLWSEIVMLGRRGQELADLAAQLDFSPLDRIGSGAAEAR